MYVKSLAQYLHIVIAQEKVAVVVVHMTVAASLQDGSQRFLPSGIHIFVWSPPTLNGANLCDQWILWKRRWVTSKAGSQRTAVSFLLP